MKKIPHLINNYDFPDYENPKCFAIHVLYAHEVSKSPLLLKINFIAYVAKSFMFRTPLYSVSNILGKKVQRFNRI